MVVQAGLPVPAITMFHNPLTRLLGQPDNPLTCLDLILRMSVRAIWIVAIGPEVTERDELGLDIIPPMRVIQPATRLFAFLAKSAVILLMDESASVAFLAVREASAVLSRVEQQARVLLVVLLLASVAIFAHLPHNGLLFFIHFGRLLILWIHDCVLVRFTLLDRIANSQADQEYTMLFDCKVFIAIIIENLLNSPDQFRLSLLLRVMASAGDDLENVVLSVADVWNDVALEQFFLSLFQVVTGNLRRSALKLEMQVDHVRKLVRVRI